MRTKFILLIVGVTILFGIANYYTGLRLWQTVGIAIFPGLLSYYWAILSVLAGIYLFGRLGAIYLPSDFTDRMILVGSYWVAMTFYLTLLWLSYDILVFMNRFWKFFPYSGNYASLGIGLSILATTIGIVMYGSRNARTPKIRKYDITINKKAAGSCDELHAVVISDLHLGLLVGREQLEQAVQIINNLNPDLILMPGDIIDENIGAFIENGMPEILARLQSRSGVFGVLGSHEYIWGHSEKALACLKQAGITILRDDYIKVLDSFYIVGRDDLFREQLVGTPRQRLSAILKDCNRDLPIILLDHQPVCLDEAEAQGIDLQLSGHTHHGQMFPLNLITQIFFENDWGYLRRGRYQLVVSSGFGTWGPPIRVGTISEILDIRLKFSP
mgnify:CR=1 FL=1